MRFRLMLALVTVAACGGGGGGSDGTPTTPIIPTTPNNPVATTSVSLQSSQFNPADILVPPSATITFTNTDGIDHNVIFANQGIASITENGWKSGARTVTMPATAGTYSYTCTLHAGMNGTVKVQ